MYDLKINNYSIKNEVGQKVEPLSEYVVVVSRNATMSKLITSGLRCKHMNCNYFKTKIVKIEV